MGASNYSPLGGASYIGGHHMEFVPSLGHVAMEVESPFRHHSQFQDPKDIGNKELWKEFRSRSALLHSISVVTCDVPLKDEISPLTDAVLLCTDEDP